MSGERSKAALQALFQPGEFEEAMHSGEPAEERAARHYLSIRAAAGSALTRRASIGGREHLVVPVVALVGDSVIAAVGSAGPELVPAQVISTSPAGWNGRPILADHPDGGRSSAGADPERLAREQFGQVFNARYEDGRLKMDAYIDVAKAEAIGGRALRVLERLRNDETVEVSVGVFVVAEQREGVSPSGVQYKAAWAQLTPDHLAMLPDGVKGACSIVMGCGAPRAAYDPSQPREPAGSPGGGRWTESGLSGGRTRVEGAGGAMVVSPLEDVTGDTSWYVAPPGAFKGVHTEEHPSYTSEEAAKAAAREMVAGKKTGKAAKAPASMKASEINRELDKLDAQSLTITDRLIASGRGNEPYQSIMRGTDPLSLEARSVNARMEELRAEIQLRYGPGAPSRLPTYQRGRFGPRSAFDPNQPRDPEGTATGGQWTATGAATTKSTTPEKDGSVETAFRDKPGEKLYTTPDSGKAKARAKQYRSELEAAGFKPYEGHFSRGGVEQFLKVDAKTGERVFGLLELKKLSRSEYGGKDLFAVKKTFISQRRRAAEEGGDTVASKIKEFFAGLFGMRGAAGDNVSDSALRDRLAVALAEDDPTFTYVEEIYIDPMEVVYCTRDPAYEGEGGGAQAMPMAMKPPAMWRRGFKLKDDGTVELDDQIDEVRRVVDYEPVEDAEEDVGEGGEEGGRAAYDPDQPRDPAGSPTGGQWAAVGDDVSFRPTGDSGVKRGRITKKIDIEGEAGYEIDTGQRTPHRIRESALKRDKDFKKHSSQDAARELLKGRDVAGGEGHIAALESVIGERIDRETARTIGEQTSYLRRQLYPTPKAARLGAQALRATLAGRGFRDYIGHTKNETVFSHDDGTVISVKTQGRSNLLNIIVRRLRSAYDRGASATPIRDLVRALVDAEQSPYEEEDSKFLAGLPQEHLEQLVEEFEAMPAGARGAEDGSSNGEGPDAQTHEERTVHMTEQVKNLVGRLLAASGTPFTKDNAADLATLSEPTLERMCTCLEGRAAQAPDPDAITLKKEEVEELRSAAAAFRALEEQRKTALVSALKAAQTTYGEAELKAKPIAELEKLADVLKLDRAARDFTGRSLPVAPESAPEVKPAPDTWGLNTAQKGAN